MYREMTAADHRRVLGIAEAQVPDVLLLLGVLDVHNGAQRFATYLDEAEPLRRYPSYLGRLGEIRVGLCAALGGPMAALHAHTWAGAGVPAIVQLGWYGALQQGTALGDIVVPRHAERQDGVSDWYLPKGILADSTPDFSEAISRELEEAGVTVHHEAIYSTPALLAESRSVIADWSRHGYHGVDMETAATFAVAKHFEIRRAAALIRFDDLVTEEDSLVDHVPAERRQLLQSREPEVVKAVASALIREREAMQERA
jgi:uridine phosphorylase